MRHNDKATPPAAPIFALIGASAGGIEALQNFFSKLPSNLGVAYVVAMHLSPEYSSELSAVLAAKIELPVEKVVGSVALKPDHIYVISPGLQLELSATHVSASNFKEPRGQRFPIDSLFRSLARHHGDGFAIILSGGGSDGALGVKAVKEAGGIVLVQSPKEAAFDSMPRAAIATGMVDIVLPVAELAQRFIELVSTHAQLRPPLRPPQSIELDADEEAILGRILAHLYARTGHDFTKYKRATVLRRISRRMQVQRQTNLKHYFHFIRQNVEEVRALFNDMLISVTTFFRDPEAFKALEKTVVQTLFERQQANTPLRIWVPGCATGEEAYSLAMLFLEEANRRDIWPEFQIFATDLDEGAITTAREGRYPSSISNDIAPERLQHFFSREDDHYVVTKSLRDCILFATHSLLKDPPFARLDLISCRNLLIYLDRDLQTQVFSLLGYALRPQGFLFLGSSESAEGQYFQALDKKHHIYQARHTSADQSPLLPDILFKIPILSRSTEFEARVGKLPAAQLHRVLLEELGPPSVTIDARLQV